MWVASYFSSNQCSKDVKNVNSTVLQSRLYMDLLQIISVTILAFYREEKKQKMNFPDRPCDE